MTLGITLLALGASAGCGRTDTVGLHKLSQHLAVVAKAIPGAPVPKSELSRLPAGVFYVFGSEQENDANVWEISANGTEQELTHNAPGEPVDAMSASPRGILLADRIDYADELVRWTNQGPVFLHPDKHPHLQMLGQVPDLAADGEIAYEVPPNEPAPQHNRDFTMWIKHSFTGSERIVYRSRKDPGSPLFGPHGQLAVIGPVGSRYHKGLPYVRIISRAGHMRQFHTPSQGWPPVWGEHAPAIVVPILHGRTIAYFPRRQVKLPGRWRPLAWNANGTDLLVQSGTELGTWSPGSPRKIRLCVSLTKGFAVYQVSWLKHKAAE
jgi:hypothetical protein